MLYTINELRQKMFFRVYDVYEIFQNFFNPQFVDLQELPSDEDLSTMLGNYDLQHHFDEEANAEKFEISPQRLASLKRSYSSLKPFILVYWPRVTVTNENDRSVQIQDLYAKVKLTTEGRIPYESRGFQLNRTTFPEVQYASGYLHSHIPHFHDIPGFDNPCLGSGPINNTILDLKNDYEETVWMLFCQELALYVTVESLRGGPYFRMEQIGSERELYGFKEYEDFYKNFYTLHSFHSGSDEATQNFKNVIIEFTQYYLEHGHLSLNYKDGAFIPGMPYFDFIIDISNSFIDYTNENVMDNDFTQEYIDKLFEKSILVKAVVANNKFYENRALTPRDYSNVEGRNMFVFKGEMKHLHIEREAEVIREVTILLNHKIAMFILNNVLKIINYRYRNEHNKQLSSSSPTAAAPTYQTVIYL